MKARPWGFDLRNILKIANCKIWERESINLHDTKLFGVLRPEVIPDGVFFSIMISQRIPTTLQRRWHCGYNRRQWWAMWIRGGRARGWSVCCRSRTPYGWTRRERLHDACRALPRRLCYCIRQIGVPSHWYCWGYFLLYQQNICVDYIQPYTLSTRRWWIFPSFIGKVNKIIRNEIINLRKILFSLYLLSKLTKNFSIDKNKNYKNAIFFKNSVELQILLLSLQLRIKQKWILIHYSYE